MIVDSAGRPAKTDEDESRIIIEHFATTEDAELMTNTELVTYYNSKLNHNPTQVELKPDLVPSIGQVSELFTTLKRRKAPGRDGILPELLLAAPRTLARIYHPIL
eukprot:7767602-Pyramimonas_sp.AAC.1